jgi:hypothetical protein
MLVHVPETATPIPATPGYPKRRPEYRHAATTAAVSRLEYRHPTARTAIQTNGLPMTPAATAIFRKLIGGREYRRKSLGRALPTV